MFEPRSRIRGKIKVIAENLFSECEFGQLNEKTLFANPHVKREKRLGAIEIILFEIRIRQRRYAQINECVFQLVCTESASVKIHRDTKAKAANQKTLFIYLRDCG
jgi:hypothetical protein